MPPPAASQMSSSQEAASPAKIAVAERSTKLPVRRPCARSSSCSSGGVGEQEAQASGEAIVVAPSVLAVLSSLELELVSCDPAYPARSDSDGGRVRFEDRAAASAGREDDAKALAKASMMRVLLPAPSVAPSVASGSFCCVL